MRRPRYIERALPSLNLRALHDDRPEPDVHIVVDDRIGDIAGMLDVDIVADCGRQGEGLVRHPECRLNRRIVPDLAVCTHTHRTTQPVHHRPETDVAVLRERDVAVDRGVRRHVGALGNCQRIVLDVEHVSVAVDRLQKSDILLEDRSPAIEIETCLSERAAETATRVCDGFLKDAPGEAKEAHDDD